MSTSTVTRATQEREVIYVLNDGSAFWSPDGEGRYWYDNLTDAHEDHPDGPAAKVEHVDVAGE